jgi:hypothetical protein
MADQGDDTKGGEVTDSNLKHLMRFTITFTVASQLKKTVGLKIVRCQPVVYSLDTSDRRIKIETMMVLLKTS